MLAELMVSICSG